MSEHDHSASGRKPDFIAYNVRESQDGKGYWNKVGAAWQHRDGQGYDIQLDSVPVDGRVTLRERREEQMQDYAAQRQEQSQQQDQQRRPSRGQEQGQSRGRSR